MDQTIFAFVLNGLYALFVGFLASKPLNEVVQRTKDDTIGPSMLSSWRFWPFVHMVTYSPLMPLEFKVLWNDVAEIAWVTILSLIANGETTRARRKWSSQRTSESCQRSKSRWSRGWRRLRSPRRGLKPTGPEGSGAAFPDPRRRPPEGVWARPSQ
ncbi:unnamed protein product [Prorocentrum cordatum]|uniref:Uncharacterized protein n=1 Tax=Prorocentrum cordatum TaxID=2364126 RepID=A0ABN9W5D4_9DINO|nr:unnamed protein product [Polarella glacialis]